MHVAYVNIFVIDLEKAIAFYRDKLGLALRFSSPEQGYASFAAGAVRLGVALAGKDQADLVGRHTGVGLEVADLGAEHARLAGLGVHFAMPPKRQPWGAFMAMISDVDGNTFYLDQVSAGCSWRAVGPNNCLTTPRSGRRFASPLMLTVRWQTTLVVMHERACPARAGL